MTLDEQLFGVESERVVETSEIGNVEADIEASSGLSHLATGIRRGESRNRTKKVRSMVGRKRKVLKSGRLR